MLRPIDSQSLQMPFIKKVSRSGMAYTSFGNGPPLILIHGLGMKAESWGLQVDTLSASNRIYIVDLPGHGESARFERLNDGLSQYTRVLVDFIDELVGEPVIVIGHSMGALIALDFACHFASQCRAFVALSSVYQRDAKASEAVQSRLQLIRSYDTEQLFRSTLIRWFGDKPEGISSSLSAVCATWLGSTDQRGYADAYSVFASDAGLPEETISALGMPAYFVTGNEDKNSIPVMSKQLASLVSDSWCSIVDNAGHMLQLTHATELNEYLLAFVKHVASVKNSDSESIKGKVKT